MAENDAVGVTQMGSEPLTYGLDSAVAAGAGSEYGGYSRPMQTDGVSEFDRAAQHEILRRIDEDLLKHEEARAQGSVSVIFSPSAEDAEVYVPTGLGEIPADEIEVDI